MSFRVTKNTFPEIIAGLMQKHETYPAQVHVIWILCTLEMC